MRLLFAVRLSHRARVDAGPETDRPRRSHDNQQIARRTVRPDGSGPSPGLVPPIAGYFELVHQSVETNREAVVQWAAWMSWVTVAAREHTEELSSLSTRRGRLGARHRPATGFVEDVMWQLIDADIRNG